MKVNKMSKKGEEMTEAETMTMARRITKDVLDAKGIKVAMQSEIAIAYMAIKAERERMK